MEVVKDYKVLVAPNDIAIEDKVRKEISRGWVPIGGVSAINNPSKPGELLLLQALVK